MYRLDPQLDAARRVATERRFPAFAFRTEDYHGTVLMAPLEGPTHDDTAALIRGINFAETAGRNDTLPLSDRLGSSVLTAVEQELCRRDGYEGQTDYRPNERVIWLRKPLAPPQ